MMGRTEADRQAVFIQKGRAHVAALSGTLGRTPTATVVTFGCQMNARDSEKLRGVLAEMGYEESDREHADFVIFNTCTVRENADNRLYGRLGALSGIKRAHPHMRVALCGCMMQEQFVIDRIRESYSFVDLIFGTFNIFRFAELIVTMFESDRQVIDVWKEAGEIVEDLPVVRKYPFKSGVNIMFGCNNFCSFCIVPYVRGRERSRMPQDILREIRALAQDGVREVMLLGQNVNSYGRGLPEETSFPALLREVCGIDGIERIRFMSSHPKDLSDALIEVMATEEKVARHVHLALQSGSDRILKLMNRHYTKAHFLSLVEKLRKAAPDVAITTDIIVGFPTETEEDVDETIDAVRQAAFENAFTFIYSKRSGTPAAALYDEWVTDDTEARIKQNFDRLLTVVQQTAKERAGLHTGQVVRVLTEQINEQDSSMLTGRMSNNTLVHFPGPPALIGQMTDVRLLDSRGFYYIGEMAATS